MPTDMPTDYRVDPCMYYGELIGHHPRVLPICSKCTLRRKGTRPLASLIFWPFIISVLVFGTGFGLLVWYDPLRGIPTLAAGVVVALLWKKYWGLPPDER